MESASAYLGSKLSRIPVKDVPSTRLTTPNSIDADVHQDSSIKLEIALKQIAQPTKSSTI